ncbi:hypothetical protein JJV70_15275 [Streptomyces sp. JJ66]|uniref:hypothetical protein n=1 Tax=Streptomyces sp. JJ66 TaxID=2803843 RepID=UPI001C595A28|nr:hypothetical protein [Streptomyces sp. JJ66]MBW1603441.1 hypothetical protein [Streptomyces sp. JJ66]
MAAALLAVTGLITLLVVVLRLLEWATTRIEPTTAGLPPLLTLPDGLLVRVCDRAGCAGRTTHVALPDGAVQCLACGHETPAPTP